MSSESDDFKAIQPYNSKAIREIIFYRPSGRLLKKEIVDPSVRFRPKNRDKNIDLYKEVEFLRERNSKQLKRITELEEKISTNILENQVRHLKIKISKYYIKHCFITNEKIELIQCSNNLKKGVCLKPCSEVTAFLRGL